MREPREDVGSPLGSPLAGLCRTRGVRLREREDGRRRRPGPGRERERGRGDEGHSSEEGTSAACVGEMGRGVGRRTRVRTVTVTWTSLACLLVGELMSGGDDGAPHPHINHLEGGLVQRPHHRDGQAFGLGAQRAQLL